MSKERVLRINNHFLDTLNALLSIAHKLEEDFGDTPYSTVEEISKITGNEEKKVRQLIRRLVGSAIEMDMNPNEKTPNDFDPDEIALLLKSKTAPDMDTLK